MKHDHSSGRRAGRGPRQRTVRRWPASGSAPADTGFGEAEPNKPKAVVWDLDGTLADDQARAHFVEVDEGAQRDWNSYFDAMEGDAPIAASIEILRALHAQGVRIVYLTGRPEYTRPKTERWLRANGLGEYDVLLMRPEGERRVAGLFKVDEIVALRERYELVCAFEDRIDVADALREAGVPVFLFGAGAEAAAEALEVLDVRQDDLAEDDPFAGRKLRGTGSPDQDGAPEAEA
jgi:FMN phosphatase YigB (HAD superfamily)